MRSKFLAICMVTLSLIPMSAHAQERKISGDTFYGCTNKKDYTDIVSLSASGDIEAAKKLLRFGISMGVCTIFDKGETVYTVNPGFLTVQVRRKGDPTGYWTAIEAVK